MNCLGDRILQPFDPELEWSAFSIHLREAQIPLLNDMLTAIDESKLSVMQVCLPENQRWRGKILLDLHTLRSIALRLSILMFWCRKTCDVQQSI